MYITETVCVVFASIRYFVNVELLYVFFDTCDVQWERLCYHWHIESLDSEAPAQRHHTDDSDSLNARLSVCKSASASPSLRSVRTSIRVPVRIPIGQPQPQPQAVTPGSGSGLSD